MTDGPEKDKVRNLEGTVLSDAWARLTRYSFDLRQSDGQWDSQTREIYDRQDGVAVLPYDAGRGTVLLVRQFRLPGYLKGGETALIETCAGMLDETDPADRIRLEAEEELGYRLHALERAFGFYVSPGSVTERITCFTARYTPADQVSDGGGKADEGEDIEVLEMPLDEALGLVRSGDIRDAKTIALIQHVKLSLG
ncbi:MAG: NUDIX domain-containing protein [Henriciella sp.]|uniref:NUDIX domain-containing protein n=1 Tax=Henriciella sp. TaxID=1968823 RepID=UPI0032ECB454